MTNNIDQEIKEIEITNDDIKGFFLISFLNPKRIKITDEKKKQNNDFSDLQTKGAFKIRGYFNTIEEAQAAAEKLQKKDPYFDIFLGQMGKWMPFDPDVNSVDEQIYREKELNDLMSGYKKQREEQIKMEEERRKKLKTSSNISDKDVKEIKDKENKKTQENIEALNDNYNRLQEVFNKLKEKK